MLFRSVESLSRFEAYDGALLEHLTEYIKLALSKQMTLQADMGYRLDRILSDILLNPDQDSEVTRQWFSEFGWLPEHRYFCINLKVAALDLENMTVRFICSHIENMLGNSCAFQYENNITIFVNLTRFGGGAADALEKIVYFLRDSFLKAGLSNEFEKTYIWFPGQRKKMFMLFNPKLYFLLGFKGIYSSYFSVWI